MKWDKPVGATQHSADGRYVIVQANTQHWVAYELHATTAKDLGTCDTDEKARALCTSHEAHLLAAHRKSA